MLCARLGMGPSGVNPLPPLNIVLHGASIWGNTPDGGTDVAVKLAALLPNATVHITWQANATYAGDGGSYNLTSNFSGDVDAFWVNGRRNRVFVGSGAELDKIDDHSGTAAGTHTDAASYVTTAKTFTHSGKTWEVWPASCIDTTENTASSPPDFSATRSSYNSLLAADFAGGDGYANLISVPELQNAANGTYFFDGIHLTDAGRAKVAAYFAGIP